MSRSFFSASEWRRISKVSMPVVGAMWKRGLTQLAGIIAPSTPLAESWGSSRQRAPVNVVPVNSATSAAVTPVSRMGAVGKSEHWPMPHTACVMRGLVSVAEPPTPLMNPPTPTALTPDGLKPPSPFPVDPTRLAVLPPMPAPAPLVLPEPPVVNFVGGAGAVQSMPTATRIKPIPQRVRVESDAHRRASKPRLARGSRPCLAPW